MCPGEQDNQGLGIEIWESSALTENAAYLGIWESEVHSWFFSIGQSLPSSDHCLAKESDCASEFWSNFVLEMGGALEGGHVAQMLPDWT